MADVRVDEASPAATRGEATASPAPPSPPRTAGARGGEGRCSVASPPSTGPAVSTSIGRNPGGCGGSRRAPVLPAARADEATGGTAEAEPARAAFAVREGATDLPAKRRCERLAAARRNSPFALCFFCQFLRLVGERSPDGGGRVAAAAARGAGTSRGASSHRWPAVEERPVGLHPFVHPRSRRATPHQCEPGWS